MTLKTAETTASITVLIKASTTYSVLRIPPLMSGFNHLRYKALNFRLGRETVGHDPAYAAVWTPSLLCEQLPGQMLVAELHQVLTEHESTCHRTCFSLRLGDVPLDSHTKLCSIQDGAVIRVEEGNFSHTV